jgi:DNA-binding NtrC family response regulator
MSWARDIDEEIDPLAKILVVDDNASIRTSIKMLLELLGFEVVTAEGGAAALQVDALDTFVLAIVDLFMPGMDGFELLKTLRTRHPRLHVVIMSGFVGLAPAGGRDFLSMATELGACRGLWKPFTPGQLTSCIEQCIGPAARCEASARTLLEC